MAVKFTIKLPKEIPKLRTKIPPNKKHKVKTDYKRRSKHVRRETED